MKNTALQNLIQLLERYSDELPSYVFNYANQHLEMERQQIEDANLDGRAAINTFFVRSEHVEHAKTYFEEKFSNSQL